MKLNKDNMECVQKIILNYERMLAPHTPDFSSLEKRLLAKIEEAQEMLQEPRDPDEEEDDILSWFRGDEENGILIQKIIFKNGLTFENKDTVKAIKIEECLSEVETQFLAFFKTSPSRFKQKIYDSLVYEHQKKLRMEADLPIFREALKTGYLREDDLVQGFLMSAFEEMLG